MNYRTIKTFFEKLNEKLGVNCFVSGTYVFEGEEVFKFLSEVEGNNNPRFGQGKLLNGKARSHNLHIDQVLFKNNKLNNCDNVFLTNMDEPYSYKQYEINLTEECEISYPCDENICSKKTTILHTIQNEQLNEEKQLSKKNNDEEQYLARETHINDEQIKHFDEHFPEGINYDDYCSLNYESKKCVLFYKFYVHLVDNTVQTYTFVKLEISPTISIRDAVDHAIHAFGHYFTKDGANRKNTWSIRREDMAVYYNTVTKGSRIFKPSEIKKCVLSEKICTNEECHFKVKNKLLKRTANKIKQLLTTGSTETKLHETNLGNSLLPYNKTCVGNNTIIPLYNFEDEDTTMFKNNEALRIYNTYVRTRNEMFVPESFYTEFLKNTHGGRLNNKYVKTTKRFPYNNREYVVYKFNTQEFIRLNKTYTLCKTLKRQTYKKTAKYKRYKNNTYSLYVRLDDKRTFIIVSNRRVYV